MSTPTLSKTRRPDAAGERYLKQLGRFVLGISKLESTSADLCRAMSVECRTAGLLAALAEVDRRANAGMPPWAPVRREDLCRWVDIACRMMAERDRLFAAVAAHRFTGSEGDAPRATAPDGTVYAADEQYLERMIVRIGRHELIGVDLRVRLEYVDPKGKSYPLGGWHLDFQDADLASDMPWYPNHLAQLPVSWRNWLEKGRTASQQTTKHPDAQRAPKESAPKESAQKRSVAKQPAKQPAA